MEHIETGAALVTVPAEAPLPPLLVQAHTRLVAARETERQARQAQDAPRFEGTRVAVARAQQETRRAQAWLAQLEQTRDRLRANLPVVQRAVMMAEGAVVQLPAQYATQVARVRHAAELARQDLNQLGHDLIMVNPRLCRGTPKV